MTKIERESRRVAQAEKNWATPKRTAKPQLLPQSRMIIDDLKRRHGDARRYLTEAVFDAMIAERVLNVLLSQDEAAEWSKIRDFASRIHREVLNHFAGRN